MEKEILKTKLAEFYGLTVEQLKEGKAELLKLAKDIYDDLERNPKIHAMDSHLLLNEAHSLYTLADVFQHRIDELQSKRAKPLR